MIGSKCSLLQNPNSGGVDILINNVGTSYPNKPTLSVIEAEFNRATNVNVKSIFLSIQIFVPHFRKRKAEVLLISQVLAQLGLVLSGKMQAKPRLQT